MANTGNTQQQIAYGASANDGTGDPLRTAFIKTDENFDNIWLAGPVGSNITIVNNTVQANDTNGNLILQANGVGNIVTNSPVVPRLNNTYSLGTANLRYRSLYVGSDGINSTGDLNVAGNLVIQGNTIEVGNVVTDSKLIHLSNTAASANAADLSGIVIGANSNIATWLYHANTNSWNSNANISAPYFFGNGSQLSGIVSNEIFNGTSNVVIPAANNNVYVNVANTYQWDFNTSGQITLPFGATLNDNNNAGIAFGLLAGQTTGQFGQYLNSVTYGDGYYAAVGYNNDYATFVVSSDGINWSNQDANVILAYPAGVTYGNSQYVAVGEDSYNNAFFATGTAYGTSWTQQAANTIPGYLNSVCWSGTEYVAVGGLSGNVLIASSPDGTTWTQQAANTFGGYLNNVYYGNSTYIGVGNDSSNKLLILTSSDASTWTQQAAGEYSGYLLGSTYGNGRYIAVGYDTGNNGIIYSSTNGVTWNQVNIGTYASSYIYSVVWNGSNQFVAVGYTSSPSTEDLILTSPDGITWTQQAINQGYLQLNSVVYNSGQYVAVGANGSNTDVILTSPDGVIWTLQAQVPQSPVAVAIGAYAGYSQQSIAAVAIGVDAGSYAQGESAVAVGPNAGNETQGTEAVAIGDSAGYSNQGQNSIAVGLEAGYTNQTADSIAVGRTAGYTGQGGDSVAIGTAAGRDNQGTQAIAIGNYAGAEAQSQNGIAIGRYAGSNSQGRSSIAIGHYAGGTEGPSGIQANNSIILNASGNYLPAATNGFFVSPVRNDTANITNTLYWNSTTQEITYGPGPSSNSISNGTSNVSIPVANGNVHINANNGTDQQWIFGTDGNLTVPGDILVPGGSSIILDSSTGNAYIAQTMGLQIAGEGGINFSINDGIGNTVNAGFDVYANFQTPGSISATGSISAANFVDTNVGAGQVTYGDASGNGLIDSNGNFTFDGTTLSVTGIVTPGSAGDITMSGGNITGVLGISATGNLTAGNIVFPSGTSWLFEPNSLDVELFAAYQFTVNTNGGTEQFTFGNDGSFGAPNNLNAGGYISAVGDVTTPLLNLGNTVAGPAAGGGSDKVTIYNFYNPSQFNYAVGAESSNMWFGVDQVESGVGFNFYGGNTLAVHIDSTGAISANGNITGNYIFGNIAFANGIPATYGNSNVTSLLAGFGSNTISTSGNITAGNFIGNGAALTNVTVSAVGNIIGTQSNVTLVAGSYSYVFDNTGNITLPANGDLIFSANTTLTSISGSNANITVSPNGTGRFVVASTAPAVFGNSATVSGNIVLASSTPAIFANQRKFDWTAMIHGTPASGGSITGSILGNASYSNASDGVQLTPNTASQSGSVAWNTTTFDFTRDFVMEWSWFTSNSGSNPADGVWASFGGSTNGSGATPLGTTNGAIGVRYLTYTNLKTQWYSNGATTGNAVNFRAGVTYQGEWMSSRIMVRTVGAKRYAYLYTDVGGVCDNAIDITGWTPAGTWIAVGAATGSNTSSQLCCHVALDYL